MPQTCQQEQQLDGKSIHQGGVAFSGIMDGWMSVVDSPEMVCLRHEIFTSVFRTAWPTVANVSILWPMNGMSLFYQNNWTLWNNLFGNMVLSDATTMCTTLGKERAVGEYWFQICCLSKRLQCLGEGDDSDEWHTKGQIGWGGSGRTKMRRLEKTAE